MDIVIGDSLGFFTVWNVTDDRGADSVFDVDNDGNTNVKGNLTVIGTVQGVTQAEFDTLTDNSIANALHRHSELVASDGTPDPAVSVDAIGQLGVGIAAGLAEKVDLRDGKMALTDADVAHGMTGFASTNTYGLLEVRDATAGGMNIWGFSDDAGKTGLVMLGIIGDADPTDNVPAVIIASGKKNGTSIQKLADSETVFQVENFGVDLVTVLGSGNQRTVK